VPAAGLLDGTFGVGGVVTTPIAAANVSVRSMATQPDGKLVVAGSAGGNFVVARYNPDGTLDAAFGTAGQITTDFNGSDDSVIAPVEGCEVMTTSVRGRPSSLLFTRADLDRQFRRT